MFSKRRTHKVLSNIEPAWTPHTDSMGHVISPRYLYWLPDIMRHDIVRGLSQSGLLAPNSLYMRYVQGTSIQ